jgi:hypothetical protein
VSPEIVKLFRLQLIKVSFNYQWRTKFVLKDNFCVYGTSALSGAIKLLQRQDSKEGLGIFEGRKQYKVCDLSIRHLYLICIFYTFSILIMFNS